MTDTPPDPIQVKSTVAPVVLSESTKVIVIAACAMAADHFMHSENAIMAVIAAAGALVQGGWGLYSRIRTWGSLRHLARLVPDSVAVVGKAR